MKPGLFVPVWHNYRNMRLCPNGDIYRKLCFGFWRLEMKAHPMAEVKHCVNFFYNYSQSNPERACGLLFRWGSLWMGAHWSPQNRRWCINLLPCVTLWVTLKGGKTP